MYETISTSAVNVDVLLSYVLVKMDVVEIEFEVVDVVVPVHGKVVTSS